MADVDGRLAPILIWTIRGLISKPQNRKHCFVCLRFEKQINRDFIVFANFNFKWAQVSDPAVCRLLNGS